MQPTLGPERRETTETLGAHAFAWAVWAMLLGIVLYYFATATNPIPLTEDWQMVPAITGHEPHLAQWLWSQNNEHRVPLGRAILYLVLKAGHGNFRAGMLCNIAIAALLAGAMILAARALRGGESRYTDAFFPLVTLHIGHWENLYWAWELTFVLPVVSAVALLYVLIMDPEMRKWHNAVIAGLSLISLPLLGGPGLVFVPLPAAWIAYMGWRAVGRRDERNRGALLLSSASVACVLCAVYFVGYQRPDWTVQPAGVAERALGAVKVLTFGFGPATRTLWVICIPVTLAILGWTAVNAARGIVRERGRERTRVAAIALFLATGAGCAMALGWGRAAVTRDVYHTWPTRYMLLIVPLFYAIYLLWDIYGPPRQRAIIQLVLCAGSMALLPLNTAQGLLAGKSVMDGWRAVQEDLNAPVRDFARRHRAFLNHSARVEDLSAEIRMMRDYGRWPFTMLRDDAPAPAQVQIHKAAATFDYGERSIRYHASGATEAILVWGINGWQAFKNGLPPGTWMEDGMMRTPMSGGGGDFAVTVPVPANASMEFGFLVRDKIRHPGAQAIWEGADNFQSKAAGEIDVKSRVQFGDEGVFVVDGRAPVHRTVRYRSPNAAQVFLVWGVGGWLPIPPRQRPAGSEVRLNRMQTPMARHGDIFEADIAVAPGTKVDCGFLITARRGLSNLLGPVWDSACTDDGKESIEATSKVKLDPEYLPYLPDPNTCLTVGAVTVVLWLCLTAVFTLVLSGPRPTVMT